MGKRPILLKNYAKVLGEMNYFFKSLCSCIGHIGLALKSVTEY